MLTTRSLRILHSSRVDRLLHAFTTSSAGLSDAAYMIRDWAALSPPLRERISRDERSGCSWECWIDKDQTWLFVAAMALELFREHGTPVLRVTRFREDGHPHDTGHWISDQGQGWRRLADQG